jgi:hypothetical protein
VDLVEKGRTSKIKGLQSGENESPVEGKIQLNAEFGVEIINLNE